MDNVTQFDSQRLTFRKHGVDQTRLSYIHNIGSEPLKHVTIGHLLEEAAKKYENINAIVSVYDKRKITYKELLHQSNKLLAGLVSLGLVKGDKIALWAPNIVEWVIGFFAATRAGLETVAINPNYKASELEHALKITGTRAVLCLDQYKRINFYKILQLLIPGLEKCNSKKISSKALPLLEFIIVISQKTLGGTYNYDDVLNSVDVNMINSFVQKQHVLPSDISNIQFSSGTTGRPKALGLTHFQIANNSYMMAKRLGLHEDQHVICVQPPLFHAFGTVACIGSAIHFGSTLVFPAPMYNSTANLSALEEEKCTLVMGTPTMYVDLLFLQSQMNKKLHAHRALITAAPWTPSLIAKIKNQLNIKRITYAYGATETTTAVFFSLADQYKYDRMDNDGYIGDHVEVKVVDRLQNIVPFGTPGELYVRGYIIMSGYFEESDKTREVLDVNNWYKTGDQVILREDGTAKVVGRLKDLIIKGGENISPAEIEEVLNSHPDILETHVIGVENERLGEQICACVRLRENGFLDLQSLKRYCREKIANYKIPNYLMVVKKFPKTASGKVQKYCLKQQFENSQN